MALFASSIVVSPAQSTKRLAEVVSTGTLLTVNTIASVAEHPFVSVTSTVYVMVLVGSATGLGISGFERLAVGVQE